MSLGSAAGIVVMALLIAEACNLALRKAEAERTPAHRTGWTLRQAVAFLAFAAILIVLLWVEHVWRLTHGEYPGIGLRHTWYGTATVWVAFALCLGRLAWLALRALKRVS
jgi:hypothetical protein